MEDDIQATFLIRLRALLFNIAFDNIDIALYDFQSVFQCQYIKMQNCVHKTNLINPVINNQVKFEDNWTLSLNIYSLDIVIHYKLYAVFSIRIMEGQDQVGF